jgi:hypothetical protein
MGNEYYMCGKLSQYRVVCLTGNINISSLVFITEAKYVYFAVRTECLYNSGQL